jgi:hypothetical protein
MFANFTQEQKLRHQENMLKRALKNYEEGRSASLAYAFKIFEHLPVERRRSLLEQSDHGFFRILVKHDLQELIYRILEGDNIEEKTIMWSIIHDNLKEGLKNAIEDGNVLEIDYHMRSFPSDETKDKIKAIITENDYALIRYAIKENVKKTIQYFLNHELTREKMQALLGMDRLDASPEAIVVYRDKPIDHSDKYIPKCFLEIKDTFRNLLSRNNKVCPVDSQTIENSVSTNTDRGSSL